MFFSDEGPTFETLSLVFTSDVSISIRTYVRAVAKYKEYSIDHEVLTALAYRCANAYVACESQALRE